MGNVFLSKNIITSEDFIRTLGITDTSVVMDESFTFKGRDEDLIYDYNLEDFKDVIENADEDGECEYILVSCCGEIRVFDNIDENDIEFIEITSSEEYDEHLASFI